MSSVDEAHRHNSEPGTKEDTLYSLFYIKFKYRKHSDGERGVSRSYFGKSYCLGMCMKSSIEGARNVLFLDLAGSNMSVSEKAMAPHSSTLAWKILWTEEPGRLQSMGSLRVGHDSVTSLSLFTFMHWRRKWQPTPMFLPGESQGRGSLVAAIYGVAQSRTRLKRLSSSSSSNMNVYIKKIHLAVNLKFMYFNVISYFLHRLHDLRQIILSKLPFPHL